MMNQPKLYNINVDFSNPLDISIPIHRKSKNVNTFFLPDAKIEHVEVGDFIGDVSAGGSCNVENIFISPHGNGTHSECVGHISKEQVFINECLKGNMFYALLISVPFLRKSEGNLVIDHQEVKSKLESQSHNNLDALIIRSLPNTSEKLTKNYSGQNPPYFLAETMELINANSINHLLTDLPSLDKEDDNKLINHHLFFNYPEEVDKNKSATELVYIPDHILDGSYILNLQIINIESDASPSRPILYRILE